MTVRELVTDKITPLKTSDTSIEALAMMDEFRVSHLPIVNNIDYLGLISEEDIFENNRFEDSVGDHQLSLARPFVTEDQHMFEAIKVMAELNLSLLPVLDKKNAFLGVITRETLVKHFAEITAVKNPGGIIILEVNDRDYSLSEIAQIVESNDAKILSLYIRSFDDSIKMEVVIKLNRLDISSVIQTFERYHYEIKASFSEGDINDLLQDRFDSFMKYLKT
jgi:acetoin utilization protein AcuB